MTHATCSIAPDHFKVLSMSLKVWVASDIWCSISDRWAYRIPQRYLMLFLRHLTLRGHNRSSGEEADNFSPVEELLLNNGEAQKCQRRGPINRYKGESEGNFGYTAEGDRNRATSRRLREGKDQGRCIRSICG